MGGGGGGCESLLKAQTRKLDDIFYDLRKHLYKRRQGDNEKIVLSIAPQVNKPGAYSGPNV